MTGQEPETGSAPPLFDYRSIAPDGLLGRFVSEMWFARGDFRGRRERIAPTGSSVLGLVIGPPIRQTPDDGRGEPLTASTGFLIGPHDRPIVNEPTGTNWAYGVVTTAVGCQAAFGHAPTALAGRVVDAAVIGWTGALRAALAACPGPEAGLELVVEQLTRSLSPGPAGWQRIETVVAELTADPAAPISRLATQVGISHGHLDREFRRVVGLTPRTLALILRLRRLLEAIDVHGDLVWSPLATELGWFDQAHLIRDFRRFTGVTPAQYVAAQRAGYQPEEVHAGFVPEL